MSELLNAKLVMTVLLGIAYIGPQLWALTHPGVDVTSITNQVGPFFGMAWAFWFKDSDA